MQFKKRKINKTIKSKSTKIVEYNDKVEGRKWSIDVDPKSDNNKDKGFSYKNCLFKNLKIENCAIKTAPKSYIICVITVDNVKYNGDFETKFGLMFCCFKCIVDRMKCFLLMNNFLQFID